MNHDQAIDWLYGTQLFGIKLGLDPVRRLLGEMGVPVERTFGREIVHVAGTNGKGSVCAMIESITRLAGRRTAMFTSPHLVAFRERVRVDGEMISESDIARLLSEIRERVSDWDPHPTFFEITLAMAARYFVEREADLWILETGMGGRLDATNVFESDVAVLTPVALDHQQWLGDTLAGIAAEKAGIIGEGEPVFSSAQPEEAMQSILAVAPEVYVIDGEIPADWSMGLKGPHQRKNAALAGTVAHAVIGEFCDDELLRVGIEQARWPGRFEILDEGGLILDGAHNPAAARVLVATWREQFGEQNATIILGAVGTKDVDGLLEVLSNIAERFIFVPIKSQRGMSADELVVQLRDRRPATTAASLSDALKHDNSGKTLVAGSLFLVGEALALKKGAATIRETEQ